MVLLIDIGNSFISTACLFKNQYIRTSIPNYKNHINKEELVDLVNFYKKKKIKFRIENLLLTNLLNLNIVTKKNQIIYNAYALS